MRLEPQEQRKACSQQAGSTEVGCANMTVKSDSCLELIQDVTVGQIVKEVQISAKQPFRQEMSDASDIEIEIAAIDSTVVIVYESAAKRRQGDHEVTREFQGALGSLSDSVKEPIKSSRSSAGRA